MIMVGETRDSQTLKTSVRAAVTGHLVLSTLHTNNAAGTVVRMLDMGAEPYLAGQQPERHPGPEARKEDLSGL